MGRSEAIGFGGVGVGVGVGPAEAIKIIARSEQCISRSFPSTGLLGNSLTAQL